jgi:DNA polymerase III epsilon subunit family exonuclease
MDVSQDVSQGESLEAADPVESVATAAPEKVYSFQNVACDLSQPFDSFVAFDLETSGLDFRSDAIVEIGAVRFEGGVAVARFSSLVRAEKTLSPTALRLTGLTDAEVAAASPAEDVLLAFLEFAQGLPLIAHHAEFDATFLRKALESSQLPPLTAPVWDSLLAARLAWPKAPNHKLETLARLLKIPEGDAHRAQPDAERAAGVWRSAGKTLISRKESLREEFADWTQGTAWEPVFAFIKKQESLSSTSLAHSEDLATDLAIEVSNPSEAKRFSEAFDFSQTPNDHLMLQSDLQFDQSERNHAHAAHPLLTDIRLI